MITKNAAKSLLDTQTKSNLLPTDVGHWLEFMEYPLPDQSCCNSRRSQKMVHSSYKSILQT
jgi:hypothetical protein